MSQLNTILCVEDDAALRQFLLQELSSAGYRVLEAANGVAALAVLAAEVPDLVLCDVTMPGMSGFELIEQVVVQGGELAQIPFLLLTELGDGASQIRARHLAVEDYLVKPFKAERLLAAVGAKVKRRRHSDVSLPLRDVLNSRALLLDQVEAARTVVASLTLLLVKVDTYLALSMRLTPAELVLLQQSMVQRLSPLACDGMVFAWSEGCWAALLAEERTADAADVLAQRITLDAGEVTIGYSCSALCISVDWTSPELRRLDAAGLVEACALHLNFESAGSPRQFIALGDGDYQALEAARYAERHLGLGIKSGELTLLFQPRVDLHTREIVGAEALVRWPHAKIGALAPGFFVPAAERMGLAAELDRWVITHTLAAIEQLIQVRPDFVLSFNVSAQSLSAGIPQLLITLLADHPAALAANLEIEVTETSMAHLTMAIEAEIAVLRSMGIKLAVDDFGMGYASLAYLKRLRAEVIKIDRSFVMDIASRSIDAQIVEGLIGLGRALGCMVVAEGVESDAQATLLDELGCRFAQGYHFYYPMPLSELLLLLGVPPAVPAA